jgi:hypothetical protein
VLEGAAVSAAEALKAALDAGVSVGIDGDDLVLQASAPPPPSVLDALSRNKAAIVALLRPAKDGWTAEDWRNFFDERAGIAEFDFGLSRPEVEARAFTCCVAEWLNRNPARSSPGSCLGCGGGEAAHDPLLPFGTGSTGHAWLHARCWQSWHAARKAEAVNMLTAMGITRSVTSAIDFGKNGGA